MDCKEVPTMKFNFDVIGKRKIMYVISCVIIIAGLVSMIFQGLNLGIDFTGGTRLDIQFAQNVEIADLRDAINAYDLGGASKIQELDGNTWTIKTVELDVDQTEGLMAYLGEKFGDVEIIGSALVGPSICSELKKNAVIALTLAIILMIIYITIRFEFHFAIAGVIALFHDILVVVAVFSILQMEVDSTFIAALLTVFGYSINDKIVVFDRIRENTGRVKKENLADIVNLSISQSFTRSMNTSISTLILLLALFLFGGQPTRIFVLAMIIGVVAGTYSSLCFASPLWFEMKMKTSGKRV